MRLNCTVQMAKTAQEMEDWLRPLVDAGAEIFHCSQQRFREQELDGSDLNFADFPPASLAPCSEVAQGRSVHSEGPEFASCRITLISSQRDTTGVAHGTVMRYAGCQ